MAFHLIIDNKNWKSEELQSSGNQDNYVIRFCSDWINGKKAFEFRTSGTTGPPKVVTLKREVLEKSAKKTIEALQLERNEQALLCMKPRFIGGAMMIVRSLIGGWKLYVQSPSRNINIRNIPPGFVALAPLQFQTMMSQPSSVAWLQQCTAVLLGGAGLSADQAALASQLRSPVYHSYGMTETASHIALRALNGPLLSTYFRTMKGIGIGKTNENCLKIKGDVTDEKWVVTNDIVTLRSTTTFEVLGRKDFVINSGGIKIHPEQVEEAIYQKTGRNTAILVIGVKDELLGEKVVLLVEGEQPIDWQDIKGSLELDPYYIPKELIYLPAFIRTETGKINRMETAASLKN